MNWHDSLDHVRVCQTCNREFIVTKGETWFASVHALPLPVRCKWHRPSRRQMAEAQRQAETDRRPA